ncbi:unnamed protein product, partial [Prorocentrum cordatum]
MALDAATMRLILGEKLDPMNKRMDELSNKLNTNIASIKNMDERLTAKLKEHTDSLDACRTDITTHSDRMDEFELRLSALSQGAQDGMEDAAGIAGTYTAASRINSLEASFAALEKSVKDQVTTLQSSTVGTSRASSSAGGSHGASGDDPWQRYIRQRTGQAPPPGSTTNEVNKCKVWIRGFPRKLMASAFSNHFSVVKTLMDQEARDHCRAQTQNYKMSYNITFDTEELARNFHMKCRAERILKWTDPRDAQVHELRAGLDQPLDIRHKSYVLGQCWTL